ncbi:MAG: hypothetical protein E6R05_02860 [Candidatus Moraniibacteriota bacterium]|nr:YbaB/EbfC family nucleoid-associated protein [Planctomycetaceae bacterium]MBN8603452.1 YbaB/EbfC family nucleoid-associated protein [Planctomycetota bacterium]TXH04001.1 MAG: hypothetical protein E6R05_02860 [Candidatus Moranbacteria bacterium]
MFNNLTGLAKLLKNSASMGEKMKESKERLRRERVRGASSCQQVIVIMNGLGEVQQVTIEETLMVQGNSPHVQGLVAVAIDQAVREARKLHIAAIQELTGGIELPGMSELLKDL